MTPDWRDARIAELEEEVRRLGALLAEALARNAALEEKLRKSSRNSGRPPSSDTPEQEAERRKRAAKITKPGAADRQPGAQPGHERHVRKLVPRAQVTQHVDCIPEWCGHCERKLRGRDPSPALHQVFHLPEVVPEVHQYALHALPCSCGHVTRGRLPSGVPTGQFGPSVVALVTMLMGVCRLGKRTVQELLADVFALDMSLGAVIGCQELGSEAIAPAVQEARDFVRTAAAGVKHSDETSWREGPTRAKVWLWTAVAGTVAVFAIQRGRSTEAAKTLLGKLGGILVSDRYSAYGFWRLAMRQVCWAHLIRDFVTIAERGGDSARIGDGLLAEAQRLFAWWHRVRDGTLSRAAFQVFARAAQTRVRNLLRDGTACGDAKTRKTCANIQRIFPALWLFVARAGVEPTNNLAEQTLRHAVLWRKISGGTHSELGSRFVERVLTVVATLRRQDRNVLSFLRDACEAQLSGTQSPSLLPQRPTRRLLATAA